MVLFNLMPLGCEQLRSEIVPPSPASRRRHPDNEGGSQKNVRGGWERTIASMIETSHRDKGEP